MSQEKGYGSRCCAAAVGQILLLGLYSLAEVPLTRYVSTTFKNVATSILEGDHSLPVAGRIWLAHGF